MSANNKIAHLGFIQGVINRMGANSFALKGWTVALVAAVFALAAKDSNLKFFIIALVATVLFWFLDGYFLWQERKFRSLYDAVAKNEMPSDTFSMDTSSFNKGFCNYFKALLSVTLAVFYVMIILFLWIGRCFASS